MKQKQKIKLHFRESVFNRDGYKCKCCGSSTGKLNAHHITDRNEMPNGGYVKENGITVCDKCHFKLEKYHINNGKVWEPGFHPTDLYEMIGSNYRDAYEKSLNIA